MQSAELRQKFLDFFEKNGHKVVSSSSLLPSDPSVLFTTAGMQQFKPYYLGEESPWGKNVASVQKCIRTSDIEEVGDERHLTFFEMLGNFSFGGYWKKEAIEYAHDFIVNELGLKIDYVTVFEGETGVPEDRESEEIWKSIDKNIVVKKFGRADNFWGPTGEEGPCGPTTEIYVNGIEIWNIVFNEFYQEKDKTLKLLDIKGVDTGMGLERLAMVVQNVPTVFETDLFDEIIKLMEKDNFSNIEKRVIADHARAISFLISDGVKPSNKDQGYILRRLIRKLAIYWYGKVLSFSFLDALKMVVSLYSKFYKELDISLILDEFTKEDKKFIETLEKGILEYSSMKTIDDKSAFYLYQTFGLPFDIIKELDKEKSKDLNHKNFEEELKRHQELSRTASAGMFKGGLADHDEKTIRLHTAHHLLLATLQEMFGKDVKQKGSNINKERLRIDFSFERKLTDEEKKKIESVVQSKIDEGLDVVKKEMPLEEAKKIGAEMEFGVKYGNTVSVYFIQDEKGNVFSKEFCGGPHVKNTSELGKFKIINAGVRRIKAILE